MLADHVDEPVLLLGSRLGFTGNAVDGSDGLPQPVPGWRQRVRCHSLEKRQRVKGSHRRVMGPVVKTANECHEQRPSTVRGLLSGFSEAPDNVYYGARLRRNFYRLFNNIVEIYFQRLCARQASLTRSKIADRR